MDTDTEAGTENVSGDTPPTTREGNQDGGQHRDILLVIFRESSLFGNTKPDYKTFIKHEEMYKAVGTNIDPSHITGLQRVNGLWRIYVDCLESKSTLVTSGIPLRGKTLPILQTNPMRLDYEDTVRIRVQNIPLSVDDGVINRQLILMGLDIRSSYREKLRIDNKLTNCCTGDRLINVKRSSLKEPLQRFMQFGQFKAKVIHRGQTKPTLNCGKCLEQGHTTSTCQNEWTCILCRQSGHKKDDCLAQNKSDDENNSGSSDDDAASSSGDESGDESGEDSETGAKVADNTKSTPHPSAPHLSPHDPSADSTRKPRKPKKAKKGQQPNVDTSSQTGIQQFLKNINSTTGTPSRSRSKSVVRGPTTPTDKLCDNAKKSKK